MDLPGVTAVSLGRFGGRIARGRIFIDVRDIVNERLLPILGESPLDPRRNQVPFGQIPKVSELEEGVIRVIAPNASPMTLDGTNTYLIYGRNGDCYILDPGPSDPDHLESVIEVVEAKKLTPRGIVVTHHHFDHAQAAPSWSRHFDVRIFASAIDNSGVGTVALSDGDVIEIDGQRLTALGTPGHTADHICFALPSDRILTGDHILGRGTSVVAYPDGELQSYISSLLKLETRPHKGIYPGHGPDMDESVADGVVKYYVSHRIYRLGQVASAFGGEPTLLGEAVRTIYGSSIDPQVYFAAELSTRAAVALLVRHGYLRHLEKGDSYLRTGSDLAQLTQEVFGIGPG